MTGDRQAKACTTNGGAVTGRRAGGQTDPPSTGSSPRGRRTGTRARRGFKGAPRPATGIQPPACGALTGQQQPGFLFRSESPVHEVQIGRRIDAVEFVPHERVPEMREMDRI